MNIEWSSLSVERINEISEYIAQDNIDAAIKWIKSIIDAGLGTPKTVGNYLISLGKYGFLKSTKVGKEKLYLNNGLMKILE